MVLVTDYSGDLIVLQKALAVQILDFASPAGPGFVAPAAEPSRARGVALLTGFTASARAAF